MGSYSEICLSPADVADIADVSLYAIGVANHGQCRRYALRLLRGGLRRLCLSYACVYANILICVILREAATRHLRHCI